MLRPVLHGTRRGGALAEEDEHAAGEGVRDPDPVDVGIRGGATEASGKGERLWRDEDFQPGDTLVERSKTIPPKVTRERRMFRRPQAIVRSPIDCRASEGEPEPRAVDVRHAVRQARPVVVVIVVIPSVVVVVDPFGDAMRVSVRALRAEARESCDSRNKKSQKLRRMESSHLPIDRPRDPHPPELYLLIVDRSRNTMNTMRSNPPPSTCAYLPKIRASSAPWSDFSSMPGVSPVFLASSLAFSNSAVLPALW